MSSLLCILLLVSSAPYELAGGIGIVVQQARGYSDRQTQLLQTTTSRRNQPIGGQISTL